MSRLAILALAAIGAWAQGRVMGTVTAADAASRRFSVETAQGDLYAVQVLPEAKVQKIAPGQTDLSKAEPAELAAIGKGDRVLARGQQDAAAKTMLAAQVVVISKQSIESRDAARQREWRMNAVSGVVKTVEPLTVQARGNAVWTVDTAGVKAIHQYADDSSKFGNARPAPLSELRAGDQVKVLGARDADAKTVKAAEVVFGRFVTIGGEIKSVDAEKRTLTVYDLTTKKNLVVQVSPEARVARMSGGPGGGSPGFGPRGQSPNGPPGGGARGPGFGGPGGGPDPSMLLERLPPAQLTALQVGDAVVLTVGRASTPRPVALTVVAGLDFLLRAPAQQASQMIANWNMDGGLQ